MESCPDEAVELILKQLTCSKSRVAFGCVSRRMLACSRAVGLDGAVREGRYGSFGIPFGVNFKSLIADRDGTRLILLSENDHLSEMEFSVIDIIDTCTGAVLPSYSEREHSIVPPLAFSPDGERFVAIETCGISPSAGDPGPRLSILSVNSRDRARHLSTPNSVLVAWGPLGVCAIFRDRAQIWGSRNLEMDAPPRDAAAPWESDDARPHEFAAPWDFSDTPVCLELTGTHALVATHDSHVGTPRRRIKLWRIPFDGTPATEIPVAVSDPSLLLSQSRAPVFVFDTPRGALLVTSTGSAFCVPRDDGAVEEFALGIEVHDCCADAGRGSMFAATRAGVVRMRAAADGWHVSEAAGDPCTSIACLPSCLATAHVEWDDITVFSPTFTERAATPGAALPPPYYHAPPRDKYSTWPGEHELLSCSSSHAFVVKYLTEDRSELLCVHTRRGDVAYSTRMEGMVRAALPVTATEAITVTVNYERGRGARNHHDTLVELVGPNRKVRLASVKQHFEGRSLLHGGTLYLVGRAGVSMIEGVLGEGPLAVVSLARKTCVSVRVELGGKRVVGTLLSGGDIVLIAPRGVFARLG